MNTFVASDPHFYHTRIIEFQPNRAALWTNTAEMNAGMIKLWNQTVTPEDEVYLLGDVSFGRAAETKEILWALNGKIYLIEGNHDKVVHENADIRSRFEWVKTRHTLRYEGKQFVLDHFPLLIWDKGHHGAYHLHGHCHGSIAPVSTRLDVGYDSPYLTGKAEHRPFNMKEVLDYMRKQVYVPLDHHKKQSM
jgi:calcineurin-like phosphoesterase family protein